MRGAPADVTSAERPGASKNRCAFGRQTIVEFENASASIPLRQIDRVFQGVNIGLGEDPGGLDGTRRVQFRRYVASVNQNDPQQLDRLGDALGTLLAEVAASKVAFLVHAAERDGFLLADGVFRPAANSASSFAVTSVEDLSGIDDRGRRLNRLASESPEEAVGGAKQLVESLCRTVLRLLGETAPSEIADLPIIVSATLALIEPISPADEAAEKSAAVVHESLQRLGAIVTGFDSLQRSNVASHAGDGAWNGLSTRHARLAVGAAVTFASFVAEAYEERAGL